MCLCLRTLTSPDVDPAHNISSWRPVSKFTQRVFGLACFKSNSDLPYLIVTTEIGKKTCLWVVRLPLVLPRVSKYSVQFSDCGQNYSIFWSWKSNKRRCDRHTVRKYLLLVLHERQSNVYCSHFGLIRRYRTVSEVPAKLNPDLTMIGFLSTTQWEECFISST